LADNLKKCMEYIKKAMEWDFLAPVLLGVMTLFWLLNLTYISVLAMAIVVAVILLTCEDVKNIFIPIIYISFFLNDIAVDANIVIYGIAVGIVAVSMIAFIVIKLCKDRATLKKGNMFWAFVVSTIAFLLGGCIGHFNIKAFGAIFGFCLLTYFLYWIAINFCNNFQKFLFRLMMYGAIFIVVIFCATGERLGGLYSAVFNYSILWVGAQHINTTATFLVFGIIGTFAVGHKNKFDYLYFLLGTFLMFALLFTFCRLMIFIGILTYITLTVIMIVKSQKKKNFIWAGIALLLTIALLSIIFWDSVMALINQIISKIERGSNGRSELWPWCIEKFRQNPIFGFGFVSDEPVPTVRNVIQLVLAHNTVLQWLTSLGIVGSVLMIYFYYKKYQIIFTRPLLTKLFSIITLIVIELNGMLDQTAAMDIFVVILTYLFIAACEKETPQIKKINLFKKKKRAN